MKLWVFAVVGLLVVVSLSFLWFRPDQTAFRRALPWRASDIHEWEQNYGDISPDYSYYLKARISRDEFERYLKKFSLTRYVRRDDPETLPKIWANWQPSPGFPEDLWWDADPSLEETYLSEGPHTCVLAKYENGFLYLKAIRY